MTPSPAHPDHLSLSILSLDDDPDFRQYIRGLLEAQGHEPRVAATPDEFFRACEERLPDVVLLDIKMGRHSGEAVLEEIRKRWPKLCVIVVTGYPSMESMRRTFKGVASTTGSPGAASSAGASATSPGGGGVFDYLAKPFSLDELKTSLTQAAAAFGLGQRPQDRLRAELGRQIRLARTEKAWTLKDLSESCGISVSQLSSIERGSHLPSVESLLAVAGALGKHPSTWFEAAGF